MFGKPVLQGSDCDIIMQVKKIRIAIIDDHVVVRMGLKFAIRMASDFDFAGEQAGGEGAGDFVAKCCADVTLLDVRMPHVDGIAALKDIRAKNPDAKVIMLTTAGTDEEIYQALEAGAKGYVLKDDGADVIFEAVRTVAAGGEYVPKSVREVYRRRAQAPALTPRENEALVRMAFGSSNREIAEALGVSEACVKVHLQHVFEKLDVHDRVGAVRVAVERGLVKLALAIGLCFASAGAVALTVAEVAAMPRAEAEKHPEAVVTGVVTIAYSWIPMSGVMADVATPNGRPAYFSGYVPNCPRGKLVGCESLQIGDIIEVRGFVEPYMVDPGLNARTITRLGHMDLPPPPAYAFEQLQDRACYNRRARMEGVVRSVRTRHSNDKDSLLLDLETDGGTVPVSVRDMSRDLKDLISEDVTVEGVLLPVITIGHEALYPELEVVTADGIRPLDPAARFWRQAGRVLHVVGLVALLPLLVVLAGLLFLRRQAHLRARAVAEDRRRIAGELHDSVAQYLSGTKILLTSVLGELGELPEAVRENLDAACDMLDRTRREVRTAINDLRNDDLLTKPLDRLLRSTGARLNRLGPAAVETAVADLPNGHSPELKRDVLAIVQEAAANAMRHGGAKTVKISAAPLPKGGFEVSVANDGAPFDVAAVPGVESGHYGLAGMRERADRSNLRLTIDGPARKVTVGNSMA